MQNLPTGPCAEIYLTINSLYDIQTKVDDLIRPEDLWKENEEEDTILFINADQTNETEAVSQEEHHDNVQQDGLPTCKKQGCSQDFLVGGEVRVLRRL